MDLQVNEECPVCIEPFSQRGHGRVTCGPCAYQACAKCVGMYLCSTTLDPHCMQCKRGWDTAALHACGLTKAFIHGPLRESRENTLWEREQAQLPATQPLAEAYKLKVQYEEVFAQWREAEASYKKELEKQKHNKYIYGQSKIVDWAGYKALKSKYREAANLFSQQAAHVMQLAAGSTDAIKRTGYKRTFVQRCPVAECNGFIDNNYTCGLCSVKICRCCRVALPTVPDPDAKHECNADTLATVRALAKDTRSCPGCATPIFKIDGCDQMWCTECHISFSWKTGEQTTGAVHNPHYYQWLRQTKGGVPRAPGDTGGGGPDNAANDVAVCCGIVGDDALPLVTHLQDSWRSPKFSDAHRLVIEIRVNDYYVPWATQANDAQAAMIRAKFLVGEISQKEFKRRTFLWNRTRQRKTEVADVLRMFCMVVTGILQRAANVRWSSAVRVYDAALVDELDALVKYTNDALANIGRLFGVMAMQVSPLLNKVLIYVDVHQPRPRKLKTKPSTNQNSDLDEDVILILDDDDDQDPTTNKTTSKKSKTKSASASASASSQTAFKVGGRLMINSTQFS